MEAKDEDWCYTNLYLIKGDFQPEKPGHDYMGCCLIVMWKTLLSMI
ncbi:hypothetical protein [Zooshikella ganghwensis]|nr:hypothetical protein [Zooshikella ganghwensis]